MFQVNQGGLEEHWNNNYVNVPLLDGGVNITYMAGTIKAEEKNRM